jgi:hypothetical protein
MGYSREEYEAAEEKLRDSKSGDYGRGDAVREAAAAGMTIEHIQTVTELARTTILRIMNQRPRGCYSPQPGSGGGQDGRAASSHQPRMP